MLLNKNLGHFPYKKANYILFYIYYYFMLYFIILLDYILNMNNLATRDHRQVPPTGQS